MAHQPGPVLWCYTWGTGAYAYLRLSSIFLPTVHMVKSLQSTVSDH
jgi:hypothetical protein